MLFTKTFSFKTLLFKKNFIQNHACSNAFFIQIVLFKNEVSSKSCFEKIYLSSKSNALFGSWFEIWQDEKYFLSKLCFSQKLFHSKPCFLRKISFKIMLVQMLSSSKSCFLKMKFLQNQVLKKYIYLQNLTRRKTLYSKSDALQNF